MSSYAVRRLPRTIVAEPPQVLALEVAADRREVEPRSLGRRAEAASAPTRCRRSATRKTSAILSGSALGVGLQLLVLEPREHVGVEALVEHDLLDGEDPLVDRVIHASAEELTSLPQSYHVSVVSLRSRAGENWNALSLRICSTRNFSASRCLAPVTGDDRVAAPFSPCSRG